MFCMVHRVKRTYGYAYSRKTRERSQSTLYPLENLSGIQDVQRVEGALQVALQGNLVIP
jgi:hypothetical protein